MRTPGSRRHGAARELAEATGSVVVLKGVGTVIAAPGGEVIVNPTGGPALATGGTGYVLLGAITGMLAQGLPAHRAAALGAYLHGAAADRLSARRGDTGLLASELLPALPLAIAALRNTPLDDLERDLAAAFPDA
jgi:NAD(P)H-hydrate repair Nnr-like enzyme with NAD(P)H-hydrate dehydratase domain